MKDLIIIGAGPAGLTAALKASDLGKETLILESDSQVGGISKTVYRDGYGFDLGGHRFFSKISEINELWNRILPAEDFLTRPRKSRIFYNEKFFDYPLKPLNALRNLGILEAIRCLFSYLLVRLFPPRNQDNFEGWVAARFGWRLYRIFFKTYTEKVWGVPATQIQSTWAAQRIKDLSLLKAVLNAFGFKNKSQVITTLINSFKYPRKGPGMMWEKCLELCINQGSEILLNHGVSRIQKFDGFYKVFVGNKEFCALNVISTAPISLLPKLLGCEDDEILQAAQNLKHRDFIIVALVMKGQLEFDDNWIYVHSEKVRVGRIQNFGSWSPEMTIPGTSCLGMEYFVNYGEDLWNTPDNQLVAFAVQELRQLNLIPEREIIETGYVVRVPKAYPVYDSDYEENLQKITSYLQNNHPKVLTIGRNGMHRYNNQDHSMLTAVLAVQNIFQKSKHDLWRVNVENEYHEEDTNSASTRGTGRAAPAFTNIER